MNVWFIAVAALMVLFAAAFVLRPFASATARAGSGRITLAIGASSIIAASGLYLSIGRPDAAWSFDSPAKDMTAVTAGQKQVGSVGSLLDGLIARLEREPDDAEGWLLLARSYQHLGRLDEAAAAYDRASALGVSDPSFEDVSVAAALEPKAIVSGRVSLVGPPPKPGSTVYVIAKRVDGSPVPVAVLRKSAAELPFDFTLSDQHSMVQGAGLGSVDAVIVSARISASGDALQAADGYEVETGPVEIGRAEHLELVIDPTNATNRQQ